MIDLLTRKRTHFVLWRPGSVEPPPALVLGDVRDGILGDLREIPLSPVDGQQDLWAVAADDCGLDEERVYWYWFAVLALDPYNGTRQLLLCTDPLAWTVDRRIQAPAANDRTSPSFQPASVVLYRRGQLVPCDPDGQTVEWEQDAPPDTIAPNNRLVIYELPARWTHGRSLGEAHIGNGTFRDVLPLLLPSAHASSLPELAIYDGQSHLQALGINALELLPPADSDDRLEWGYGTANYLAADFALGHPNPTSAPTASTDLAAVVDACHQQGMRFFCDMVMAFARNCSYRQINFHDFFVQFGSGDIEEEGREGFGGDLWKYDQWVEGYGPVSGARGNWVPAREFMKLYLAHWMSYYRVDGLRLDSVNNIKNYDFLQEFTDLGHALWRQRGGGDDRFLVVGEDLALPMDLLEQHRLDGLWNERFKGIARQVILGHAAEGRDFETSVRMLIDCRQLGFSNGTQAVNYLTSHDIGGPGNERLGNWLRNNGVTALEERVKLAFTCLLTAVGVPMILAGDEFAEQQDLDINEPGRGDKNKQIDPIDFNRMGEEWRQRIFAHVARLVRLRTSADALAVDDTAFIHADLEEDRRVVAWQRGSGESLVVVVANFSDYATPDPEDPATEYRVPNFPPTPDGKVWREVAQDREVAPERAGREPLAPWSALVYALR